MALNSDEKFEEKLTVVWKTAEGIWQFLTRAIKSFKI